MSSKTYRSRIKGVYTVMGAILLLKRKASGVRGGEREELEVKKY